MKGNFPDTLQSQWEKVYLFVKNTGKSQSESARIAWNTLKGYGWHKNSKTGDWVNRSDFIPEFSLHVSKASSNHGVMRWSAVNSDTEWDLYNERMSLDLYKKMLGYIKEEVPPPAIFKDYVCSEYWCGGMPYLSLSHYPDLNGKAVPGEPLELFVDGKQLKASGILFDSDLGKAVFRSLKADENKPLDSDRIRISIAFIDLAHKHTEDGKVFERKSLTSVCPECVAGIGDKIYMDGYLVHLALTRVPVNPRTIMTVERSMAKKTRKEDAESIVEDKNLIDDIDKTAKLEHKSEVLVEMANTEPEDEPEETEPVIEDSKAKKEDESPEEDSAEDEEEMPMDKKKKVKKSLTEEDIVKIVEASLSKALQAPAVVKAVESNVPAQEPIESKSALDTSVDALYNAVNNALVMDANEASKLQSINPALAEVGEAITALVKNSLTSPSPAPVSNETGFLQEQIASLQASIESLKSEIQTKSATTEQKVSNRIPVPRSISPTLTAKSEAKDENPNSVRNISRRSVGIRQ